MDRMSKEQRSRTMSKIRSTKTGFEKIFFKEIRKHKVQFKTHYKNIIGRPDIALPKLKKVVFIHSDFWHGWQFPRWKDILPNDFWRNKLTKNRVRDRKVVRSLRRQGWSVFVLWEHSYKKNPQAAIANVIKFLKDNA